MHKGEQIPTLKADLVLLHAPAFYDFRSRNDIYFPFLGTSGDVPITPLYEYFPIGFKTLERYLTECGHSVSIINLATLLLRYPKLNFEVLISNIETELIGIDLHWMVHVQGSLKVAEHIKKIRSDLAIVFGGISATYYSDELIRYPFVDMVFRGYDTHEPMHLLLKKLKQGDDLRAVPNLLYKSKNGQIHDNGFSFKPKVFGCGIDWSRQPCSDSTDTLPILELLSTLNAGCSNNCSYCGGSRKAFRRIFKNNRNFVFKPLNALDYEFDTMKKIENIDRYHFYSVGTYNIKNETLESLINRVGESNLGSISFEQYQLTPDDMLKKMAQANRRTIITLSPDSHEIKVGKAVGRGVYTNEKMEQWIEKAIDYGIYQIDIWYFIGMPEQDETSVNGTVEYCRRILEKFKGYRVQPIICPMIPFLDPGSDIFENPDAYGYRVFYRTLEDHRRGMENASIINRINYETKWLNRSEIVHVGYKAVRELMKSKSEFGYLPSAWTKKYIEKIDDALEFIDVVHELDCIDDQTERNNELSKISGDIQRRNESIFFSGVSNQAFPINRKIGGRWFDELGWESCDLRAAHTDENESKPNDMKGN